ncbi:hypothetical protein DSCW_04460 [Desulfosarcina widdelii]|uniref:Uncharacterized protein n=1 Tax=Desulfosarcina widdelii TaxID=947919 RepID=A0A5K7YYB5_9BACT|nr:hypothetical protein [Desulfosarcina widdelii]BBO73029.1 hypothetical protein DSCW_04460 [Desulfosarcina widdelii]
MRNFPFRALILCVLLPPFVYVFSIQFLEKTIQASYEKSLAEVYTGDTRPLFDGSVRLQDAIRENVGAFIASRKLTHWGVRLSVSVKTADGDFLYPYAYDGSRSELDPPDSIAVARENFRLLNDGLVKTVEVEIEHNTLLSNLILLSCVALSLMVFMVFYRRGIKMIRQEDLARQQIIDNLSDERQKSLAQLQGLEDQRKLLSERVERMKTELDRERRKATAAEDEMIDELVVLEEKISENLALQESQLDEIDTLKEKIRQYEKDNEAKTRQRLKGVEAIRKRFNALYKNTVIHERAIEGFVDLTDEMKIKAEEVIHQLNDDPKMVQIKRKVFGKKNRETVFEVIFAYKGRLYFRNIDGNRVEVLVVGTKLTQNKDLSFLDKL